MSSTISQGKQAAKDVAGNVQKWAQDNVQSALSNADLPSTDKVNEHLESAKNVNLSQHAKDLELSNVSQRIAQDSEQLITSAQELLSDKLGNDELQNLIKHGALAASKIPISQVASPAAKELGSGTNSGPDVQDAAQQASQQAQQLARHFFDVTRSLITTPQFRNTLEQLVDVSTGYLKANADRAAGHAKQDKSQAKKGKDKADEHKDEFEAAIKKLQGPAKDIVQKLQNDQQLRTGAQQLLDIFNTVYHQSVDALNEKKEDVKDTVSDAAESAKNSTEGQEMQKHAQIATDSAKQILSNFGGSLEPLQNSMTQIKEALKEKKPEFDQILSDARDLLQSNQDWDDKGKQLMDKVKDVVQSDSKVSESFSSLADNSRTFLSTFQKDKTVKNVQDSFGQLVQDLLLDSNGQPVVKQELLGDLQKLLPVLLKRVSAFSIGRVESQSDEMDLICDNVEVSCDQVAKDIQIRTATHMSADAGNVSNSITVEMRGIHVLVEDMVFYYYRKSFPSITDVGVADILLENQGMDIDITLQPSPSQEEGRMLQVVEAKTTIHDLSVNIKKTNHSWLMLAIQPVLSSLLSARLETYITASLKESVEKLDQNFVSAMKTPLDKAAQFGQLGAQLLVPNKEE